MLKKTKFSGNRSADARRGGNKMLSMRGMSVARYLMEVQNSIARRSGKKVPSGVITVCGCGNLTCCFFSSR